MNAGAGDRLLLTKPHRPTTTHYKRNGRQDPERQRPAVAQELVEHRIAEEEDGPTTRTNPHEPPCSEAFLQVWECEQHPQSLAATANGEENRDPLIGEA